MDKTTAITKAELNSFELILQVEEHHQAVFLSEQAIIGGASAEARALFEAISDSKNLFVAKAIAKSGIALAKSSDHRFN